MPTLLGRGGNERLPLVVKNTFIHLEDELATQPSRFRRSSSGPALLKTTSISHFELGEADSNDVEVSTPSGSSSMALSPGSADPAAATPSAKLRTRLRESQLHHDAYLSWQGQDDSHGTEESTQASMDSGSVTPAAASSSSPESGACTSSAATQAKLVAHRLGNCEPCAFFLKASGCRLGESCVHCHFCTKEESEQKIRFRKRQIQKSKKVAACIAKAESRTALAETRRREQQVCRP
eukprot:gb/GFBE01040120.1/.p1 GENE.gb/GFBE01040120.1/~~gb/GFBE01040120.1/.p1  ORF type:complete len:237 (+),score=21.04 gb/GFBE01040120.1/:1-711(+)